MKQSKAFFEHFNKMYLDVKYSEETGTGSAYIPNVGTIEFHDSANDPAVVINFTYTARFKGSADTAIEFIDALHDAWSNSD